MALLILVIIAYLIVNSIANKCTHELWSSWKGVCSDGCSPGTQYRSRSSDVNCDHFVYETRQCTNNCKHIELITLGAEQEYYQLGHTKLLDYENATKAFGSLMACTDLCHELNIKEESLICISCLNYDDCKLMPLTSEVVVVDIIHTMSYSNGSLEWPCKCYLNLHSIPSKGLCDIKGFYTTYKLWNKE